jgi:hypothetical protein
MKILRSSAFQINVPVQSNSVIHWNKFLKAGLLLMSTLCGVSAAYSQNSFPENGDVLIRNQDLGGNIIFVDGNHAIYGRRNLQGFADAMSFYEYGHIDFYTGGSIASQGHRLRIAANGNVGIGTSDPSAKLQVNGGLFRVERNSTEPLADFTNTVDANFEVILSNGGSADKKAYIGPTTNTNLVLGQNGIEAMRIVPGGNVAIGTTDTHGFKLAVVGNIIAEGITVKLKTNWPDYVFKPSYQLRSLTALNSYIQKNRHLPEMPSEKEVANEGVNLGEIVKLQTKKIEELTLYLIEQNRLLSSQKRSYEKLQRRVDKLEAVKGKSAR